MLNLCWPYQVRVNFPGHNLHGKICPALRTELFSEQTWDIKGPDGIIYVLPLNRAAAVGKAKHAGQSSSID